jgi:predicted ATPase
LFGLRSATSFGNNNAQCAARTNFGKYDKFITSCIIAQAQNKNGQINPWADLAAIVRALDG